MTDPATETAALVAAIVYLGKTVYELVIRARNGNGHGAKCHADEVITQAQLKVQLTAATLQSSIDRQTGILEDIKKSQDDTRDGVRDLVSIQRRTK